VSEIIVVQSILKLCDFLSRVHYDTEVAKLKDKMEYLNRDVTLLKQSLELEQELKLQSETKCSTLIANHRNLLSK